MADARVAADRQGPKSVWFRTVTGGADSQWSDTVWGDAGAAEPWPSAFLPADAASPWQAAAGHGAFERLYRAFVGARAALGAVLMAAAMAYGVFSAQPDLAVLAICVVYATCAIGLWLLPRYGTARVPRSMARPSNPRWLATIGVDIVCFVALFALSAEAGLNSIPLLVLPVLMAGVLTPRLVALATVACVTLALLAIAWLAVLGGSQPTVVLTQAGLAASGFFVIAVLGGEVARRLAREELAARGSLQVARHQAELNRLVLQEMSDGVMVIDRRGRVRTANPAARALLAAEGRWREAPFSLHGERAWKALVDAVEEAFATASWPEAGRDVPLDFAGGTSRTLRVRVRFTRRGERAESDEFCVLFLEDVRSVQARMQQEKLAAMGRVSAGIAHEIRNPLAAIVQANALLLEDAATPMQRRLAGLVASNAERLKRIVEEVLEVAAGADQTLRPIDACAQTAAVCAEWARAAGLDDGVLHLDLPDAPIGVAFDDEHLRRVLVNLLDNARRHASGTAGAIRVRLRVRDEHEATLSVASDGPPIEPEVERFLFEPFFSTRSRGTGLGLYICRELCERYGASIRFRLHPASERLRNEFPITLRRRPLPAATAAASTAAWA